MDNEAVKASTILSTQASQVRLTARPNQPLPDPLLALLNQGNTIEAIVEKTTLAQQVQSFRVNNLPLFLALPIATSTGDIVQLWQGEKAELLFKVIPNKSVTKTTNDVSLKVGQLLPITVQNIVNGQAIVASPSDPHSQLKPTRLVIDVTAIPKPERLEGRQLLLQVMTDKPLTVVIKPLTQQVALAEAVRLLTPKMISLSERFPHLNKAIDNDALPLSIKKALETIVVNIASKQATMSETIRQGLQQTIGRRDIPLSQVISDIHLTANQPSKALSLPNRSLQGPTAGALSPLLTTLSTKIGQILGQSITAGPIDEIIAPTKSVVTQAIIDKGSSDKLPKPMLLTQIIRAQQVTPSQIRVLQQAPSTIIGTAPLPAYLTEVLTSQQASVLAFSLRQTLSAMTANGVIQNEQLLLPILKEIDSIKTRMQFNQLLTAKEPDNTQMSQHWVADFPLKDKSTLRMVELELEKLKQSESGEEEIWQVTLCLDTVQLGAIEAKIILEGTRVDIFMLAEQERSVLLLTQYQQQLEATIADLMLVPRTIQCQTGTVMSSQEQIIAGSVTDSLVDVSA